MTKVRIRRVLSRTRWQLVTFCGEAGGESVGIVDLMAVRKDHGKPVVGVESVHFREVSLKQFGDSRPGDRVTAGVSRALLSTRVTVV
jgi:hypothetical protein